MFPCEFPIWLLDLNGNSSWYDLEGEAKGFPALRDDFLAWVQAHGAVVRDSMAIPLGCNVGLPVLQAVSLLDLFLSPSCLLPPACDGNGMVQSGSSCCFSPGNFCHTMTRENFTGTIRGFLWTPLFYYPDGNVWDTPEWVKRDVLPELIKHH